MKRDSERLKRAIWVKAEKRLGIAVPPESRANFEENLGYHNEDTALEDFEATLDDFCRSAELLCLSEYFSDRKGPKEAVIGKRYQKCFEKSLYLVEFVMDRRPLRKHALTFLDALKGGRINWKRVRAEWNEANPHDPMSPGVLKVRYYRAIAAEDIQREYYRRRYQNMAGVMQESFKEFKDHMERLSEGKWQLRRLSDSVPETEKVKALSFLPKEVFGLMEAWRETHPSISKWQQIKTACGSKELQALNKVWFTGEALNPSEEALLQQLYLKYPLGQNRLNVWLKQTLKQVFEKSVVDERQEDGVDQVRNLQQREANHEGPHS